MRRARKQGPATRSTLVCVRILKQAASDIIDDRHLEAGSGNVGVLGEKGGRWHEVGDRFSYLRRGSVPHGMGCMDIVMVGVMALVL